MKEHLIFASIYSALDKPVSRIEAVQKINCLKTLAYLSTEKGEGDFLVRLEAKKRFLELEKRVSKS